MENKQEVTRGAHISYTTDMHRRVDIWDRMVNGKRDGYLAEYFDSPGNPVALLSYRYLYQAENAATLYTEDTIRG